MDQAEEIRVAITGYGVIGKRVADAVACQEDMTVAGVCDVTTDWRPRVASRKGYAVFGASAANVEAMDRAGLKVAGTLDDLLRQADVIVDCTPKRIAAKNISSCSPPPWSAAQLRSPHWHMKSRWMGAHRCMGRGPAAAAAPPRRTVRAEQR